jgi:hypothetical protein
MKFHRKMGENKGKKVIQFSTFSAQQQQLFHSSGTHEA